MGNILELGLSGAKEGLVSGITSIANPMTWLGLGMRRRAEKRQFQQQLQMMDKQAGLNKELAQFNHGLALDMWEKTNYAAQREQMEKAKLSPALMYGQSGQGGTTVGAGAAGPVGMGASTAVGVGLDAQRMMAEIQNINAQTEKIKADTTTSEANTDYIKKMTDNLDSVKALNLASAENQKKAAELMNSQMDILAKELEKLGIDVDIAKATKDANIQQAMKQVELTDSEIKAKLSQIGLNDAQKRYLDKQIDNYDFYLSIQKQLANASSETAHANTRNANTNRSALDVEKWKTTVHKILTEKSMEIQKGLGERGQNIDIAGMIFNAVKSGFMLYCLKNPTAVTSTVATVTAVSEIGN